MALSASRPNHDECQVREILARIWDKWTLAVVWRLGDGPLRFTELRRAVQGISERMLTVTLRRLERDGLVGRTVFPVVPPRVDYRLTEMGISLLEAVSALFGWTDGHVEMIIEARAAYDSRVGPETQPATGGPIALAPRSVKTLGPLSEVRRGACRMTEDG